LAGLGGGGKEKKRVKNRARTNQALHGAKKTFEEKSETKSQSLEKTRAPTDPSAKSKPAGGPKLKPR